MKSRTWYKLHKWIAISVGIFLFTWSLSGILMMLPPNWFLPSRDTISSEIDYHSSVISPSDAVLSLEQSMGIRVDPISVEMLQIHDLLVYKIILPDFSFHMVDSASGEPVWINEMVAEQIALDGRGSPSAVSTIVYLEQHDLLYPFGELPVYRVVFEGDGSNMNYVSPINGNLSQSNNLTRIMAAVISLHTFEPVRLITEASAVRKGLLIIFGGIGVLTALTGYLLFFLPYIRRKQAPRTSSQEQVTKSITQ